MTGAIASSPSRVAGERATAADPKAKPAKPGTRPGNRSHPVAGPIVGTVGRLIRFMPRRGEAVAVSA